MVVESTPGTTLLQCLLGAHSRIAAFPDSQFYASLFIEPITRLVAGAQFVHILRHGPDVVASLYDVGVHHPAAEWARQYRSLDAGIERWARDVRISRACAGQPDHQLVRYEDLVADPATVLAGLCRFVGVPFEATMLTDYGRVAGQVVMESETWKATAFQAIGTHGGAKFQTVLDQEQQRHVLEHIPSDLLGIT